MRPNELKRILYEKNYPPTFEVNAETYGLICQEIFTHHMKDSNSYDVIETKEFNSFRIAVGKTEFGILFKNVELILKEPNAPIK
jgi:hypothetical protein